MEMFWMMASYFSVVYHILSWQIILPNLLIYASYTLCVYGENVVLYQENKVADFVYCFLLATLVTLYICSLN